MDSKEQNPEQEQRDSNCSSGPPDGGSGAVQDRMLPDPELVAQLRAYLEHVIRKAEDPPIYLGSHDLSAVYVRPDVYRKSKVNVLDKGRAPKRISWESECERAMHAASPWRAAVLGLPGQGKSLLLMRLALQLARAGLEALQGPSPDVGKVPLPVVIRLNDLANVTRKTEGEIPDLDRSKAIRQGLRKVLRGQSPSPLIWGKAVEYIVRSAETRSVWLLLDALDEVPDPSNLIKILQPLENWDCHVILSSRPHAYEAIRLPFAVTKYHLAPFSPKQTDVFLQGWLTDRELQQKVRSLLKRPGPIKRMATNPLLLTLLCGFEERHGVRDELTRSELYDGVFHDILGLAADKRSAIDYQRAEAWLPLLVDLMWKSMWTDGGKPMATEELITFIERSDKSPDARDVAVACRTGKKTREHAVALLKKLGKLGILVPVDGKKTAFRMLHHSFTEYLAARAYRTPSKAANQRS